ncbi:hypothetical protein MMC11_006075 [Xylographa trunciseda]|nr:hypothetical protein [Xylographa trunciseda]
MPSRNVVQDSDDEEDIDARTSPAKGQEPLSEVHLNSQNDGMEFVDFGSPSPPNDGSTGGAKQSAGEGSSELLSQAIHKAHRDLVEPSPDAQVTTLHDDGANWSWTSPVTEKVKRRKTTMEEFGSSAGIGLVQKKVLKTYGSPKTRDDKALRGGVVDTRWAESVPDADTAAYNHDASWPSQENKKRRITVTPDDLLVHKGGPDRKRSKRRFTTTGSPTEGDYMNVDEQYGDPLLGSTRDLIDMDFRALKPSATVSNDHLEHLTLPSMENSMRPPVAKDELQQQVALKTSVSSTIPDTPIEAGRSQKLPSADQTESSARMPSPTISGKSSKEILTQSTDHVNDALEYLAEVDMEEPVAHFAHPSAPKQCSKDNDGAIASRLPSTQGSTPGTQDELSMIAPEDKAPSTAVQKTKSKQRLSETNNVDELGSDDVAIGLPAEQYQPRPSRSRASRTVDDLLLTIDYSKRPEAVVKARNKRRKTEGDQLAVTEEIVAIDLKDTKVRRNAEHSERPDFPPQEYATERTHPAAKVAMVDTSIETEDMVPSAYDLEPAKKKRGRPKKQPTTDDDNQIFQSVSKDVIDLAVDADLPSMATATSTAKKSRKRKKTQDSVAISEEIVVEGNESPSALQIKARERNYADGCDTSLDTSQNSANIIKAPIQPIETQRPSDEKISPAPEVVQSKPPPETPRKTVVKGPGKHSPLNTGKVPYRVGLSKRARIEPLLRIVRK